MALSLCHMATHHASTVCFSIVSSVSPMHPLMIPRTTLTLIDGYIPEVRLVLGNWGIEDVSQTAGGIVSVILVFSNTSLYFQF